MSSDWRYTAAGAGIGVAVGAVAGAVSAASLVLGETGLLVAPLVQATFFGSLYGGALGLLPGTLAGLASGLVAGGRTEQPRTATLVGATATLVSALAIVLPGALLDPGWSGLERGGSTLVAATALAGGLALGLASRQVTGARRRT